MALDRSALAGLHQMHYCATGFRTMAQMDPPLWYHTALIASAATAANVPVMSGPPIVANPFCVLEPM